MVCDSIPVEPKYVFVPTANRDNKASSISGTRRTYFFECNRTWGERASLGKVIKDFLFQQ